MAGYRPLESVCVAYTSSKDDGPTPSALHDEPQCRYYAWTPLWLRWFLDVLVTISLYWTLFSTVPLDLILKLSRRRGPRRDVDSEGHSKRLSEKTADVDGRVLFALHPHLPLLASASTDDKSLGFYDVETSRLLWLTTRDNGFSSTGQAEALRIPSCMQFSDADHLAIGHTDGTVLLLKCRFSQLIPFIQKGFVMNVVSPEHPRITLLRVTRRDIYKKLIGAITNLHFSPKIIGVDESSGWLAIGTDQSGVWLWSLRSSQVTRIVSGGGINPGCLSWTSPWVSADGVSADGVSLSSSRSSYQDSTLLGSSTGYSDLSVSPLNISLSQSTVQRQGNAFGTADDMASLNDYYVQPASPTMTHSVHSESPMLKRSSATLPRQETIPTAIDLEGRTLIAAGTNDGKIRLLRIFHSSSMLRVEATFEVSAADVAEQAGYTSVPAGAITNLVLIPSTLDVGICGTDSFTILTTASAHQSSQIHTFNITVPARSNEYAASIADTTELFTKARSAMSNHFNSLANSLFPSRVPKPIHLEHGTGHWASTPLSSVRTSYLGFQQMHSNLATSTQGPPAKVLSIAANPTGTHLLVTIAHSPHLKGKCLLFATSSFTTNISEISEIRPIQPSTLPSKCPSQTLNKSPYMAMLSPSELARLRREQRRAPPSRVTKAEGGALIRSFEAKDECLNEEVERRYGIVGFGTDGHGDVIGAYVYLPASLLDEGSAIGLFVLGS